VASVFEVSEAHLSPIRSPPVTSLARRAALTRPARGCERRCSYWFDLAARALVSHERQTGWNWSAVTGESTSPGEDPTGASAEREGGFDPQSKAGLAQGVDKGAWVGLARLGRTALPWGGPGCVC
jgi:hypothetical protein